MIYCWAATVTGASMGLIVLVGGLFTARDAPQQAAAAAIGIGLAVIPYCFSRAVSEIRREFRESWRGGGEALDLSLAGISPPTTPAEPDPGLAAQLPRARPAAVPPWEKRP